MSLILPHSASNEGSKLTLPPLSLYVHIPWCVQKCPYCDFNSHSLKGGIPETEYVQHLLHDLEADLKYVQGRKLHSIFFGGGTPSLFSAAAIDTLLAGIEKRLPFSEDIEITLEANPGTVEASRFKGYVNAGVNRISLGIQSLSDEKLKRLGRIHNAAEAFRAIETADKAGLNSFNLDLMHGLPDQSTDEALYDLSQLIALKPKHLSWYQLTIEPNTQFASKPPVLPQEETLWAIQEKGHQLLAEAGYQHYEISGYSQPGFQCRHNLNYWRYGDYLGIGCGAHGKITQPESGQIVRTVKVKHPKGYMDLSRPYLYELNRVDNEDRPFEFFMNRLRLMESFNIEDFSRYTGLPVSALDSIKSKAVSQELLNVNHHTWQVSSRGHRYLNDLLGLFV